MTGISLHMIILWSTACYPWCTKNSFSISNKILYIGTYYSILIYHGMKMAKYMLTATSFLNGHLLHYTLFWKLYIVILTWKWDIMTRCSCPHHLTWKHWNSEWTCMARSRVNRPMSITSLSHDLIHPLLWCGSGSENIGTTLHIKWICLC